MIQVSTLAANLTKVVVHNYEFFFSYSACVAFWSPVRGMVVSRNIWSNTTARHIGTITASSMDPTVVEFEEFKALLDSIEIKVTA